MDHFFNPNSPAFVRDPYPFYRRLRRSVPFYASPLGFLAVTRERDVRAVLADKRFGRDFQGRTSQKTASAMLSEPAVRSMSLWMLVQDPPAHTRLRALVVKAFTARRIQDMRPRIQAIVDGVLDGLAGRERIDLIGDFASQIPATVICELLGIPHADRQTIMANSMSLTRLLDPAPLSRAEMDHANRQHLVLAQYYEGLFEQRRKHPRDDLTTQLVLAEEQGSRLSPAELTANVTLLFAAGFDTTANLIGNALLALFRHPDQLARLRAEPSLMGNAVEEFLRYDSSVQLTIRAALEDLELGGRPLPRGSTVACVLASANRDEEVYEEPDRLDIARANIKALSFGGGIHHCLGAQLGRLEAEIAIGEIIRRFPDMRLEDSANPLWRRGVTLRGLTSLPARI
jgi:cytochrome P450